MNTHSETFTPLVCSVIGDALLKAMPAIPYCRSITIMNFSDADLLNFYANFVDLAHYRQLLLSQKHVTLMRVR